MKLLKQNKNMYKTYNSLLKIIYKNLVKLIVQKILKRRKILSSLISKIYLLFIKCKFLKKKRKIVLFKSCFFYSLFLTQIMESEGELDSLSKIFIKNRHSFELYISYSLNRQYSETTLNTYKLIRKLFNVSFAV
jgi:hypothetical protein